MSKQEQQAVMGEMLKALLAVAGETLPGFEPIDRRSHLPAEVVSKVRSAIVAGAEALNLAAVSEAA